MIEIIKSKILDDKNLCSVLELARMQDRKIVFTNGCFDLLHQGHIDYLAKARGLGDMLIVGLNTDNSVKRLKGNTRPIQDEQSRALILASLLFVDYVVMFDEDTPYNLIKKINPDVLVKGADYKKEDIVGYDIVELNDGKIMTLNYLEGYSTSNIIRKIIQTQ